MTAKKNYTNFCLLFILSLFFSCKQSDNYTPLAKDGYLDLSDWDFEKNGVVTLDGAWEFYWNKLYTPQNFQRDSLLQRTGYINVPGIWNQQIISGQVFPGKGYATYRLRIKLNRLHDILAIKFTDASSSYKLWINNKMVASNGIVDSVSSQMKPQYLPMVRSFDADSENIDLIIQVSNNLHCKGGLWASIKLGTQEQLTGERDFTAFYTIFLSGVFFFLFIYHLWIYFLRKREKAALWFGLLCLSLLFRNLLTGERFLYVLFPNFDLNIGLRLEYLPLILGPTLNAVFTAFLFPQEFPKKALRIILWLTAIETIIILFTPTWFFTDLLIWFELTLIIKFILTIFIIIKAVNNKRLGAIPFLLSMLILVVCAGNDIFFTLLIINTADITPIGFFISVLAQTYVLAYRISFAFGEVEDLSANLEKKVEERTRELREEKIKVEEHRKEIIDSITYAKRLQLAILPPVELLRENLSNVFILYNPKDIVAGDFYWMAVIDNTIFLAAADCTGHGVPGALVSVVCSNALNRTVKEFALRDTGKILDKVTDLVMETFEKSGEQIKDGMDISLLSYNKANNNIQWSGANNPLWYIQNGQLTEVKADKQPIGKFDIRKPFTTHTIGYSENTTFYLFTDGLPDQFGGPKGKKFMYKRFENNLIEICKLPMNEQQAILEKGFQEWKGELEQVDDVTVIGIRI